jgi:hypothetical protein
MTQFQIETSRLFTSYLGNEEIILLSWLHDPATGGAENPFACGGILKDLIQSNASLLVCG